MTAVLRQALSTLGLILASTLVALFVGEVFLWAVVPLRNVGPSFNVYDATYGKALRRNMSATRKTPEYTMRVTINSLGFRGPEPDSFPSRAVLFLGDSFTFGYGVNDGEEYPALVRAALAERYGEGRVPVVNAGIGHSGQGRWVKFLANEGARYKPRAIVLQFLDNDFDDNVRDRLFDLSASGELIELPVPPPGRARLVQDIIEFVPGLSRTHLVGLLREVWQGGRGDAAAAAASPSGTAEALTYNLTERALITSRQLGCPVIALIIDIDEPRLTGLKEVLQRYDVPTILVEGNTVHPDLYYPKYGHWNARGHVYTADLILTQLTEWDIWPENAPAGGRLDGSRSD
jgi:lysophospholipase L1-like esterase